MHLSWSSADSPVLSLQCSLSSLLLNLFAEDIWRSDQETRRGEERRGRLEVRAGRREGLAQ